MTCSGKSHSLITNDIMRFTLLTNRFFMRRLLGANIFRSIGLLVGFWLPYRRFAGSCDAPLWRGHPVLLWPTSIWPRFNLENFDLVIGAPRCFERGLVVMGCENEIKVAPGLVVLRMHLQGEFRGQLLGTMISI